MLPKADNKNVVGYIVLDDYVDHIARQYILYETKEEALVEVRERLDVIISKEYLIDRFTDDEYFALLEKLKEEGSVIVKPVYGGWQVDAVVIQIAEILLKETKT